MAIGFGVACPKPPPRIMDRIAYKRNRDKQERLFKLAVWMRDGGRCRHCGIKVVKSLSLVANRGEVHHLRGRNVTPEDRFNVDQAVLLCAKDHADRNVVNFFRKYRHA